MQPQNAAVLSHRNSWGPVLCGDDVSGQIAFVFYSALSWVFLF